MGKFLFGFILGVLLLGASVVLHAPARPVAVPVSLPYDVTVQGTDGEAHTVVVQSTGFTFENGCFITKGPKVNILCKVLQVTPCTEQCYPAGAPAPTAPQPIQPSAFDPNTSIAENTSVR